MNLRKYRWLLWLVGIGLVVIFWKKIATWLREQADKLKGTTTTSTGTTQDTTQ